MRTFKVIDTKTGEEPNLETIALDERWAGDLIYCDVSGFMLSEDGCLYLADDTMRIVPCPEGRFRVEWDDA